MFKYYVFSGSLSVVLLADNPESAACKALISFGKSQTLGPKIWVNERGFDSTASETFSLDHIQQRIKDDYTSK